MKEEEKKKTSLFLLGRVSGSFKETWMAEGRIQKAREKTQPLVPQNPPLLHHRKAKTL